MAIVCLILFSLSSIIPLPSSSTFSGWCSRTSEEGRCVGTVSSIMGLELPLLSFLQSNNNNKNYDLAFIGIVASVPFSTISFASTVATQINGSFLSADSHHCRSFISLAWRVHGARLLQHSQTSLPARGFTRMTRWLLHRGPNRHPVGVWGKLGVPLAFENLLLILSE